MAGVILLVTIRTVNRTVTHRPLVYVCIVIIVKHCDINNECRISSVVLYDAYSDVTVSDKLNRAAEFLYELDLL